MSDFGFHDVMAAMDAATDRARIEAYRLAAAVLRGDIERDAAADLLEACARVIEIERER